MGGSLFLSIYGRDQILPIHPPGQRASSNLTLTQLECRADGRGHLPVLSKKSGTFIPVLRHKNIYGREGVSGVIALSVESRETRTKSHPEHLIIKETCEMRHKMRAVVTILGSNGRGDGASGRGGGPGGQRE